MRICWAFRLLAKEWNFVRRCSNIFGFTKLPLPCTFTIYPALYNASSEALMVERLTWYMSQSTRSAGSGAFSEYSPESIFLLMSS